jgi:cysteine synthase
MTLSQSLMIRPGLVIKLEMNNPGGSHKYRAARHIIELAIESGGIVPGRTTVIEKTGGNFGFGLLAVCQRYGIQVDLAVGLSYSARKRELLAGLGANLIGQDMLAEGASPAEVVEYFLDSRTRCDKKYFYTDQFSNALGVEAHQMDTGGEFADQIRAVSKAVNVVFVGCAGTGASFTGVCRGLCDGGFKVEAHLIEPAQCDTRSGQFSDHRFEGIAVGVAPPFLDWGLVHRVHKVTIKEMVDAQRWAYGQLGIYIGNSSAGCLAVARSLHCEIDPGDTVVACISYDSGHWYSDMTSAPRDPA